ncbi:MAG: hypothetical protein U1C96_07125 [Gallionella sp.]|nr:hypothetical protein [Gallionella sp.]
MNAMTTVLLILWCGTSSAGAEPLGRLFFTPEERARFDRAEPQHAVPAERHRPFSINGIVQKHGGGRTVWINGQAQNIEAATARPADSERVALPGQGRPVEVKVGQRLPAGTRYPAEE